MLSTSYQYIFIHVSCMTEHLHYGRGLSLVLRLRLWIQLTCIYFAFLVSFSFAFSILLSHSLSVDSVQIDCVCGKNDPKKCERDQIGEYNFEHSIIACSSLLNFISILLVRHASSFLEIFLLLLPVRALASLQ